FVADEPVHALPRYPASIGLRRKQLIELLRARSAGQADRGAAFVCSYSRHHMFGGGRRQRRWIGDGDDLTVVVRGHGSPELSPASAVAPQQFVGFLRALAAGLVGLQSVGACVLPGVEERLYGLPAGFDAVSALEQDIVADHAVIDQ